MAEERNSRGMTRAVILIVMVLGVVLAACTGGDDTAEVPDDVASDGAAPAPAPATAAIDNDVVVGIAETWLTDTYGMGADVLADLSLLEVTTTPGAQHVRFGQLIQDIPVLGGQIIVHVRDTGEVQTATDDLVDAEAATATPTLTDAQATDIAAKAVTGQPAGTPQADLTWMRNGTSLALTWRVVVSTTQPTSSWTVLVDAGTGAVLSVQEASTGREGRGQRAPGATAGVTQPRQVAQATTDACDAPAPGACVFLPDPIYGAGGTLADRSRANDFLAAVDLLGLSDTSALVGEYVNAEPDGAPVEPTRESDSTWATGRAGRGFEAAMAYYWIDRVQRDLQRLGFSDILAEPFPVFPVDPDVVDNAFYSPAEGAIHLGVGSDGVNEGEDASGIVHEYGHALLDTQAAGLLGNAGGGAYHESFGDLLAFLTTLPGRTGDAGCLFAWAEAGQCLRRVDSDKVYPDDLVQEVHDDGEIYNGAIHDVTAGLLQAAGLDIAQCPGTQDCAAVTDRVLTTLLASNTYLPRDPSLPDVAEAFRLANDAAFDGADADVIDAALAAHGLTGGGEQMVDSGGQPMAESDGVSVALDISHSYRGDLDVSVVVVDADFVELCSPVQLFVPDDTDDADDLTGEIDLSDSDCAAFAPPGPDQLWVLQVIDTLAEDEGKIVGFAVMDAGVPYLAPGLPQPIGDADPDGAFAIIDGSGEDVRPDGSQAVTDGVDGDGPVLTLDITHTYTGDLSVSAGVADADSTILCSVSILEPDPSDSTPGVAGDVDMSECGGLYPPTPTQRWYLLVSDTAALDEGTVDQMTLTGPDGLVFSFDAVPLAIPDDDVDGVALLLDGTGGTSGQAGGGGTSDGLPAMSVDMAHTFQGDLAVTAGVLSADGEVLCEVVINSPDPENSEANLLTDTSMAPCARYFPPTQSQPWYLFAADTLAEDTGTVNSAVLIGPNQQVFTVSGTPVDLPDADPTGVILLIDGTEAGLTGPEPEPIASGEVVGTVVITHPFIGDLEIAVGVASGDGTVICEETVRTADATDNGQDLAGDISFGTCSGGYPPNVEAIFYLQVIDTAAQDIGTIDAFAVTGPDGRTFTADDLPATIPDADPDGTVVGIGG